LNFLESCRKLVGLDSTPAHGNRAAAEFISELCAQAGLHVECQVESVEGVDQCNVMARPQQAIPAQELMLQTHLDTVDPGHFSLWTQTQANPFNASIYNDVMYGLGTADSKLDFLCKLEAAKSFAGRKLNLPFVLVGTFGAQNGMAGAIKLIRRKKVNATRALIGEPTDMRLMTAGAGLAVVEISVRFSDEEKSYRQDHDLRESTSTQSRMFSGKAAHSSDPAGGQNAIMRMLDYLTQLPSGIAIMDLDGGVSYNSVPAHAVMEIDFSAGFRDPILPKITAIYKQLRALEAELANFHEEGFEPPHATMNVGVIRTFIEDVRLLGSCRLPPSITPALYDQWLQKLERAVREVGATFRVRDYRTGFRTEESGEFVQGTQELLKEMGLPATTAKMTMATEANVFQRLGMECLVWGPGQSVGNSHAPNERIKISDLAKATDFYRRFMERFCL